MLYSKTGLSLWVDILFEHLHSKFSVSTFQHLEHITFILNCYAKCITVETTSGDSYDVLMQWELYRKGEWRGWLASVFQHKDAWPPSECPHTLLCKCIVFLFWKPISRQTSQTDHPASSCDPFFLVPQRPPWSPTLHDCLISLDCLVFVTWWGQLVLWTFLKPGSQPPRPWVICSQWTLTRYRKQCKDLIQECKLNHWVNQHSISGNRSWKKREWL